MDNKIFIKTMFVTLLILGGMGSGNVFAQKNLEKWVESCGKNDDVNYSLISKKDKITKKMISNMISITFKNSEAPFLMDELHEALAKDKKDAVEIIESKQGGVLKPEIYKFYNDATKQDVTYIFSETKNGTQSVVVTTKDTPPVITKLSVRPKMNTVPNVPKINTVPKRQKRE